MTASIMRLPDKTDLSKERIEKKNRLSLTRYSHVLKVLAQWIEFKWLWGLSVYVTADNVGLCAALFL